MVARARTQGLNGIALGAVAGGIVLIWSGLTGRSWTAVLRAIVHGQDPADLPQAAPIAAAEPAAAAAGIVVTPPRLVGPANTSRSRNRSLGRMLAASYGWGSGQQWDSLDKLVMSESGWNNRAQNPRSTAFGIGQFLDSTWAGTGYRKTSDPATQIKAMLVYIRKRYGDPVHAWAFKQANNYY